VIRIGIARRYKALTNREMFDMILKLYIIGHRDSIGALKQTKDRLLEDEVDKYLWKDNVTDNRKPDEIEEGPIILHGKII
jgi:hypothetical protein